MAKSKEEKEPSYAILLAYRGWTAYGVGVITGLIFSYFTHIWQLLIVSAILSGLFAKNYKKGAKYGSFSVLTVYCLYLLNSILFTPALQVLDVFLGIIGLSGMGVIGVLITLMIGYLVGLTGGYLGSVISSFITWPE